MVSVTDSKSLNFTKLMRKATRNIHDVSDALVNAKLGLAASDEKVWAEGLLCFYEIFKYLEGALDRYGHTLLGELDIKNMRRTKAFEEDLEFYYGKEWIENVYQPKSDVVQYLTYLSQLEEENPILLSAYIYHLYVGLFSGGQILRKKRTLETTLKLRSVNLSNKGEAVTDFGEIPIYKLKNEMVSAMERVAEQLGEEDRWKLIEESKNVFIMNNKMIRSINTNQVVLKKIFYFTLVLTPFVLTAVYFGFRNTR